MKKTFDVYFAGRTLDNWPLEAVKQGIGKFFNLSDAKVETLFSGTPVRIKKDLSAEKAGRLRKAFLDLGALVEVVPAGEKPSQAKAAPAPLRLAPLGAYGAPPPPPPPQVDISGLSLADPERDGPHQPPRTAAAPLPDISALELAPPGEIIDAAAPSADIPPLPDISHLDALPPNTGSLEEVAPPPVAAPSPDISGLRLEE